MPGIFEISPRRTTGTVADPRIVFTAELKANACNIIMAHNDALQEMIQYYWPGNIRELEHVVEHSVISSKSSKLTLAKPLRTTPTSSVKSLTAFRIKTLNDNEKEYILSILKYCNGRVRGNGGAAQLLDIHPNTLESRMLKLGIRKEHVMS